MNGLPSLDDDEEDEMDVSLGDKHRQTDTPIDRIRTSQHNNTLANSSSTPNPYLLNNKETTTTMSKC